MESAKPTILIVDDAPLNITVLSEVLGTDYEVVFATNGMDALEIAIQQTPDLILLDVMMPDMDGYEVCRKLKTDVRTRKIPVIFISIMHEEADEAKGLEIGAIDYIAKPFSPSIVLARVRNHLELKRYRDFLENLSATDGLTGIPNRRHFDEFLEREWRRGIRNQSALSLIMMDIDYFKLYNDRYGHLIGDDCLKMIATMLSGFVGRLTDLVARYGGEEFVIVLPDTQLQGALHIAHQVRHELEKMAIPHEASLIAPHVTLSMGAAVMVPHIQASASDLIRRADARLYDAKEHGRNQIRY